MQWTNQLLNLNLTGWHLLDFHWMQFQLYSIYRLSCVSNCDAWDRNYDETLFHTNCNDMVWCPYALIDVSSNLIVDWNYDCKRDIYAVILPNEESYERPMFAIDKILCHIPNIWKVSPLNECTFDHGEKKVRKKERKKKEKRQKQNKRINK